MTEELKFVYDVKEDYEPVSANGCYGGRTPKGDVVLNFFREGFPIPESETFELTDDGFLGERKSVELENPAIIRKVCCGVTLSEQSAREIYEWLGHILNP